MASFRSEPLQSDLLSSSATWRFKYPSAFALKARPFPHFLTVSPLNSTILHDFSMLSSSRNSHAANAADRMLQREQAHERDGRNGGRAEGRTATSEKTMEVGVAKQRTPYQRSGDGRTAPKTKKMELWVRRHKEREEEEGKAKKRSKKDKFRDALTDLRVKLDMCSKRGDVMGAIALYDSAVSDGIILSQYHYSVLLYLCSAAAIGVIRPAKSGSGGRSDIPNSSSCEESSLKQSVNSSEDWELTHEDNFQHTEREVTANSNEVVEDAKREEARKDSVPIQINEEIKEYARSRGLEIYEKMFSENIPMSEAALTSAARLAMSMNNGELAFQIVKQMKPLGITPRLRSYGPALLTFCKNGDVDKAFEVEAHMLENGVQPEEPELAELLRASIAARRGKKVYYLLHKLRTNVRQVSSSTAELIELWFKSSTASRVGKRKWDTEEVTKAIENGGGGWHGLGWLGRGKWNVSHTFVSDDGVCMTCGNKLVTIDLDPVETENFAKCVASLAKKRERNSNFQKFQKWLDYYGPFEAVVDAANVGLFSQKRFSLRKVNAVVNAVRQKLPMKRCPLIVVHNRRLTGSKMNEPTNMKLLEKWKNADAIYETPTGSNDDWYWLYAAITCKCLIVTNDEMRDHIFQVLGNDFFPRWKERHQAHFRYRDGSFEFEMPPPCSIVIQENERGHWHIPISAEQEQERKRTWLCATRANMSNTIEETSNPPTDLCLQNTTKSSTPHVGANRDFKEKK
ncbi:proteinaceous RNase P 1, chloroplastic/mitochondrial-like isoform X1 [Canna indica]|uniref:ribonuclease P n=1 Tax=Canna indica TaxID=4628 RepID=A0AAQ3QGF6_9LILI|nr:proteinaceous RNase P 1, chloroplastic/mitochondrial-like isoform X1 [Canna indica]